MREESTCNVHSVINIHTGTNVSIAPYRDIYTYEGVQLINLLSKLDEGDATVIAAADRVNSLYEEYCTDRTSRERKENCAAKVVEGSLIFLAGAVTAVFLSRTAGAVTMYEGATIVVGAFSYIAITHGLSNVAEGVQEYRFGCSRDTESVAVNYVRDYVYFGNEKVYNGVTNLGATGCSVYLTGMGGYMYAQTYGIPIWQGELIQGGIALTSAGADRFVTKQVSTMDVDPWTKNLAGPVTGLFAGSVGNAAVTRYGIPAIKQANTVGNVGSSRSITEIATQNTAGNTSYGKPSERIGDFTDLYGTTVDDILDRIPDDAILREIRPVEGGCTEGFEFKWVSDGKTYRVRVHNEDPSAPIGSNASNGWVVRVQQGRKYYDYTVNEFMDAKYFNPNGDFFDENIVNNSHIPIKSPYEN